MKKQIKLLLVIVLTLVVVAFAFAGCEKPQGNEGEVSVTLILANGEEILFSKEYVTDGAFLKDLVLLADEEENISFNIEDSQWGAFINSFSYEGVVYGNPEAGEYIGLYTSLADINYIDIVYMQPIVLEDIVYNAAGLGISELPLFADATYIIYLA
ncbi:MAG: hypothetical protein WC292_03460 [Clostridia bacterium]